MAGPAGCGLPFDTHHTTPERGVTTLSTPAGESGEPAAGSSYTAVALAVTAGVLLRPYPPPPV